VYINPLHWDKKNQKIRNVIEIENRDEINSKLAKLKIHIIDEHNIAFMDGKIIDKQWIDNSISKFLLRPKKTKSNQIFIYLI
jgi:ribonucleotide reductase alpha subunit